MAPPFERYPGPARRDAATLRVISPWRDALAWVSIAGPLAITRYLVREREEEPWTDVLRDAAAPAVGTGAAMWTLVQRDPIEVEVRTVPGAPLAARAWVRVTREACEVRVAPAIDADGLRALVAVGGEAVREAGGWRIVLRPDEEPRNAHHPGGGVADRGGMR